MVGSRSARGLASRRFLLAGGLVVALVMSSCVGEPPHDALVGGGPGVDVQNANDGDSAAVLICHLPPGEPDNPQTIAVAPDAVAAHVAHGDSLAPCPDATDTDSDAITVELAEAAAPGGPPGDIPNSRPCGGGCNALEQCCVVGHFPCTNCPKGTGGGKPIFGCVETLVDPLNCGTCEHRCPGAAPDCDRGKCVCLGTICTIKNGGGMFPYSHYCAHTDDDEENCGGCGRRCRAGATCCAGECVSTALDNDNCGACGNRCSWDESCCAGDCAACSDNGCDNPQALYPVAAVNLTGSCGSSPHVIGGNWTYAWGLGDLGCLPFDPGTPQTLSFTPAFPVGDPRQETIAFDFDWSTPVVSPDPNQDNVIYVPIEHEFESVTMGTADTYTFPPPYATGHIVRYWHGQCAVRKSWAEIFDPISEGILDSFTTSIDACTREATALWRDWDRFAPNFFSEGLDIRHGFSFEAHYTAIGLSGYPVVGVYLNPAYVFRIREADGLLDVENVRRGVVSIADTCGIQEALKTDLPKEIEHLVETEATKPLQVAGISLATCTPGPTAQQDCYHDIVTLGLAHDFFAPALAAVGYGSGPGSAGDVLASRMQAAMDQRNFSCFDTGIPGPGQYACAFHPVFQAVNVLPNEVEFVVAPEPISRCTTNVYLLYHLLPAVLEYYGDDGSKFDFCGAPAGRPDGQVPVWTHGRAELPVSYGCGDDCVASAACPDPGNPCLP